MGAGEGTDQPVVDIGLSAEELEHAIEKRRRDGYEVSALTGFESVEGDRFAGIWTRRRRGTHVQVGIDKDMVSLLADLLARMSLAAELISGTPFATSDEFDVKDGVVEFMTDNPEITLQVQLAFDTVEWAEGQVPEEVQADSNSWLMSNGKLSSQSWLDQGQSPQGSVEMEGELAPTSAGHWIAPSSFEASIERVRLGYGPMNVRAWTQGARYQAKHIYEFKARLSDDVLLVPVEVGLFYATGTAPVPFEARAKMVLDGQSVVADAWTSAWDGEIRTFARRLDPRAPSIASQAQQALHTPDSIFRQANIAFRFRAYDEFEVEPKQAAPRHGDYLEDQSAFQLNANLFDQRVMAQNRADALRIVVMDRVMPVDSPFEATSNPGFAGVSRDDFATFYLSHEIAHIGGLPHVADATNLMNKQPSDVHLTAAQIASLRHWAQTFRNQWV
jgi:hypothetical protein